MLTWLAPILVFGLVIFVHELGHFLAAKSVNVYVPRFSIGFGPALWKRRRGETQYMIGILPLGGYVRMASREDEAMAFLEGGGEHAPDAPHVVGASGSEPLVGGEPGARRPEGVRPDDWDPNGLVPFGPRPVPEERYFESKTLLQRLLILVAGVTMNVLLALGVEIGLHLQYGRPYLPAVVDSVLPGQPAALAGLRAGDSIVRVDGIPVRTWEEVVERVGTSAGDTVRLEVVRGGAPVAVTVVPRETDVADPVSGETQRVGRIGAAVRLELAREQLAPTEAVREGWRTTWRMAGTVVTVVRGLFRGTVGVENLGGPIAIARSSVQAAEGGLETLFSLIAFLSINVAVLNLLPIPILDGGQILLNVLEAAKGSPFSPRTRDLVLRAGVLAIGLLFVLVMFNDLRALVEGWAR